MACKQQVIRFGWGLAPGLHTVISTQCWTRQMTSLSFVDDELCFRASMPILNPLYLMSSLSGRLMCKIVSGRWHSLPYIMFAFAVGMPMWLFALPSFADIVTAEHDRSSDSAVHCDVEQWSRRSRRRSCQWFLSRNCRLFVSLSRIY